MSLKSRSDTPVPNQSSLIFGFTSLHTERTMFPQQPFQVQRQRDSGLIRIEAARTFQTKPIPCVQIHFCYLLHYLFLLRRQQLSLSLNLRRICVSRVRFHSKEIQPQNKRATFSIFKLKQFQGPIWLVNPLSYYKCHLILPFPSKKS